LVAERIVDTLRDGDVVGRYGGDEVVVILPAVSADEAATIADRLIGAFRDEPLRFRSGAVHRQSLSIGIASTEHLALSASVADLLAAADEALYEAKRLGRDRWCSVSEHVAPPVTS
jgi:diguanylate cyclase (GGDEF)-like protein